MYFLKLGQTNLRGRNPGSASSPALFSILALGNPFEKGQFIFYLRKKTPFNTFLTRIGSLFSSPDVLSVADESLAWKCSKIRVTGR